MLDDIDWDLILKRSDEFAQELYDVDGVDFDQLMLPGDIIYQLCKKGLNKADPRSCYE